MSNTLPLPDMAVTLCERIEQSLRSSDSQQAEDACSAAYQLRDRLHDAFEVAAATLVTRIIINTFNSAPSLREVFIQVSAEERPSVSTFLELDDPSDLDLAQQCLGALNARDVARYFGEAFGTGLRISRDEAIRAADPFVLAQRIYQRSGRTLPHAR